MITPLSSLLKLNSDTQLLVVVVNLPNFHTVSNVIFSKLAQFCNLKFQALGLKNRCIPGIFDQCNNGHCKQPHKAATKDEAEKLVTAFEKASKIWWNWQERK
eukprot:9152899-Ditylum_brightwellii.AAC.1